MLQKHSLVLITKVEEEEGSSTLFDCAVAPHYQKLRCAFQQIQSTTVLAFSFLSTTDNPERATDIANSTGGQIE